MKITGVKKRYVKNPPLRRGMKMPKGGRPHKYNGII